MNWGGGLQCTHSLNATGVAFLFLLFFIMQTLLWCFGAHFFLLNFLKFILYISHSAPSSLPVFSPTSHLPPPPTTLPQFRKGQAFHGSQQNMAYPHWLWSNKILIGLLQKKIMAYQVKARPSSSGCIKTERGIPAYGIGSKKSSQRPWAGPDLTARGPTNRLRYTTDILMQKA